MLDTRGHKVYRMLCLEYKRDRRESIDGAGSLARHSGTPKVLVQPRTHESPMYTTSMQTRDLTAAKSAYLLDPKEEPSRSGGHVQYASHCRETACKTLEANSMDLAVDHIAHLHNGLGAPLAFSALQPLKVHSALQRHFYSLIAGTEI